MSEKRDAKRQDKNDPASEDAKGFSRRDFVKAGAVAGVGAATLGGIGTAVAKESASDIEWDYEADLVVCGAGCTGLPAAIRAHDLGASVLVIDQNFDVGGRMAHSGGWVSLGGNDVIQQRDYNNAPDADGFISVDRQVPQGALEDDIERLWRDVTDWSMLDTKAYARFRYNNPDQHRGWAENCPPTRQFLMDNYVRFARINGTHMGGGATRARASFTFLPLGDVTDVKRGSVTAEDAGIADPERQSAFCPAQLALATDIVGPNAVYGGGLLSRCLEYSAREKGVRFMMNRYMTEIIQDEKGQVIGVRAQYTPRFDPDTGKQLKSYWSNGNIEETRDSHHQGPQGRGRGHQRPSRQPGLSQPVLSAHERALVPQQRLGIARPAGQGRQRHHRRDQRGRRASTGCNRTSVAGRGTSRRASAPGTPTRPCTRATPPSRSASRRASSSARPVSSTLSRSTRSASASSTRCF